jgi:glutamine amidotransferase
VNHNDQVTIGIMDYGLGNIFSIQQALHKLGIRSETTKEADRLKTYSGIILPGVGAFGEAMDNLKSLGLDVALVDYAQAGLPIFGICLGLQLLMSTSYEFGAHKGLGLIEGSVERFPNEFNGKPLRVPFIGWNNITLAGKSGSTSVALRSLEPLDEFYFIHSYYATPKDPSSVVAYADYLGFQYPVALKYKNVFATQFHPEKSGEQGLGIFSDWANSIGR